MTVEASFTLPGETSQTEAFLRNGYVIVPVENSVGLDRIRTLVASVVAEKVGLTHIENPTDLLNQTHQYVSVENLNAVRLAVINALRSAVWFRPTYFSLARDTLGVLVGNELAMQRGIGLSVQLPEDDSSLLPIHADVWDGDSKFEVVAWLPLVDCYRTKSMFIVPPAKDRPFQARVNAYKAGSVEDLYRAVEADASFLDVPYGSILVFSQTLMHGNRINRERETRWSMNCRFKSVFSPYADKKLGEFFEPITLRPVTRMALDYKLPQSFDE
jgi:sporadic carbohydrate cluster 2OG-Fe(II) oxygenase